VESFFSGRATDFLVDADMPLVDLGDGNQLELVVQVVSAASQRPDFVLRLMASAYIWHVKCQDKVNVGL
jgi:hypothetical protein